MNYILIAILLLLFIPVFVFSQTEQVTDFMNDHEPEHIQTVLVSDALNLIINPVFARHEDNRTAVSSAKPIHLLTIINDLDCYIDIGIITTFPDTEIYIKLNYITRI